MRLDTAVLFGQGIEYLGYAMAYVITHNITDKKA